MRSFVRSKLGLLGLLAVVPLSVSATTEVYVPLGSANAVAVIDAESDRIVAEIPGINGSHGLAVSMDGKYILAGSLLERPKGEVPPKPKQMSEDDHAAHHSNKATSGVEKGAKSNTVGTAYLIDAKARRVLRQIDVPGAVHHVLVTTDGKFGILTHPGRGGISVLDIHGHRLLKEVATGPNPNYAVTKRDGSRIYVSNAGNDTISEIDTVSWTVLRNLPAGKTPEHIVLSADERFLYAVNPTGDTVSRVDLKTAGVTRSFAVGKDPHGVDLSDDGLYLYASSKQEDKVTVFNLATGEEKVISLSPAPYHVSTIRGTGKVYVSSRKYPKIWILDQRTMAVHGEIPIKGEGHEMGMVNR